MSKLLRTDRNRRSSGRALLGIALLYLPGCRANWDRVVQYSPDPARHSAVVEVYRAVLTEFSEAPRADSLALQRSAPRDPPTCRAPKVPGHWVDTLKHEVRVALSDPSCSMPADPSELASAARDLGLTIATSAHTAQTSLHSREHRPSMVIAVSRPGFNRDSSIAAVRLDVWCGPICGSARTLLLARKPGMRWRVWHGFLHRVS